MSAELGAAGAAVEASTSTQSNFDCHKTVIKSTRDLGYGFSIMGGDLPRTDAAANEGGPAVDSADRRDCSPIYISKIRPGAPADGKVKIGAQIIEINGNNIVGRPHTHVISELKRAKGEITLVTRAPKATSVYLAQVSYEKVKVLFPFHAQKDDELELIRGDVIYVMGKGTDGWAYGVCQRTGLSGMFPGNFAVLMQPAPEVLDSIYSELEARKPGFTHRGHAEVLYDELPSLGNTINDNGSGDDAHRTNASYASVGEPTTPSAAQTGAVDVSRLLRDDGDVNVHTGADAQDHSVYAMAKRPASVSQAPEVRLVGKALATFDRGSQGGAEESTGDDEPLYAPIVLPGKEHGEIMYSSLPAAMGGADDAAPVIDNIYSTVGDKTGGATSPIRAASGSDGLIPHTEDIYATLDSVGKKAPEMPSRRYDKSLVAPTIRVHVADGDEENDKVYELLPWQKEGHNELDVDTVAVARRTPESDLGAATSGQSPGPALPPRQETLRRSGATQLNNPQKSASSASSEGAGTLQSKAEIKQLRKQQKQQRKQLLKEQRDELKTMKREAKAREKEAKKERAAAKKEHKKLRSSLRKSDAASSPSPSTSGSPTTDGGQPG
eukprot:m.180778 g.180778  ORF g.180778 m.180778 type:complete len:609 (-) comp15100_c0_seq1:301-2127(-)